MFVFVHAHGVKWNIADLLTSSHPQMSASHLLGLQDPQQTPASTWTISAPGYFDMGTFWHWNISAHGYLDKLDILTRWHILAQVPKCLCIALYGVEIYQNHRKNFEQIHWNKLFGGMYGWFGCDNVYFNTDYLPSKHIDKIYP